MPYYAVARGRSQGIYNSWGDCEDQVKGFSGARYKKFNSEAEARSFVHENSGGGSAGSSEGHSGGGGSSGGYNTNVYTDGACSSNGRSDARAGYGVWWGDDHPMNESGRVERSTNNSGEIRAAVRACQQAKDNGLTKITINTDSKFLIDSATKWMPGWKRNGYQLKSGGPVKNRADFEELDRAAQGLEVQWRHVEAHRGIHGNEKADELARRGAAGCD